MKALHMISFILVIVGGLNWGLIGIFDFNLVTWLLGSVPVVERIVYIVVGLATLILLINHKKECSYCTTPTAM